MVKSAKRALAVIFIDKILTEETLASAMVEVESLLKSRP